MKLSGAFNELAVVYNVTSELFFLLLLCLRNVYLLNLISQTTSRFCITIKPFDFCWTCIIISEWCSSLHVYKPWSNNKTNSTAWSTLNEYWYRKILVQWIFLETIYDLVFANKLFYSLTRKYREIFLCILCYR